MGAGIGTLSPHFLPLITDAGVARAKAAGYAAVIGPSLIVGRLVGGALLDRFPARFVVAVSFSLPAVACAILLSFNGSPVLAIAAAIFIGMSYGAEGDMIAYITAQYFGRRHYAWAYAAIFAVFALSYGFSTVAAGAVYDSLGSYHVMLLLLIVGLLAAVGIVASLGKPPGFAAIAP